MVVLRGRGRKGRRGRRRRSNGIALVWEVNVSDGSLRCLKIGSMVDGLGKE